MYSVGSGLEAISRVLEVKGETVYSWVKKSPLGLGVAAHPGEGEGKARPRAEAGQANIL